MGVKKTKRTKITTIEGLAELIVDEFAKVDERFNRLEDRADKTDIRLDRIEEQIVSINGELRTIRAEIADLTRRIDALERSVRDIRGYAVEIDELRARVQHMEKFLKEQGMTVPK